MMTTTTRTHVIPLLHIQDAVFAEWYHKGVSHALREQHHKHVPLLDTSLVQTIMPYLELEPLQTSLDPLRRCLGWHLGMVHGSLLNPYTGEVHPALAMLVTLTDSDVLCGYWAGRQWFFVDTESEERRLTDTRLMRRLHKLATDTYQHMDKQVCINFSIGCLLGELSGWLFSWTVQEQHQLDQESLQLLGYIEPLPHHALARRMAFQAM